MSDELETRLRERLHATDLPAAPESLRRAIEDMPAPDSERRSRRGGWIVLAAAALALAGIGAAALLVGGPDRELAEVTDPSHPPVATGIPTVSPTATLVIPRGWVAFEKPGIRFAHPADWQLSDAFDSYPGMPRQRVVATFARGLTVCPNTEGVTPTPTDPPGGCESVASRPGTLIVYVRELFGQLLPATDDAYGEPTMFGGYRAWTRGPYEQDDPALLQWTLAGPDRSLYTVQASVPLDEVGDVRAEIGGALETLQLSPWQPEPVAIAGWLHLDLGEFSFDYPEGWKVYYPSDWSMVGSSIVTVASQPLDPPCDGDRCQRFTTPPGTMAVEFWITSGLMAPDWSTAPTTLGGQPAFTQDWGDQVVTGGDEGHQWGARLDEGGRRQLSVMATLRGPGVTDQRQLMNELVSRIRIGDAPPASTSSPAPGPSPTPDPTPTVDAAHAYPDACDDFDLSPRRCAYIVEQVKAEAGIPSDQPVGIELLDNDFNGVTTSSFVVRVRIVPEHGEPSDHPVWCVGVGGANSLRCTNTPVIDVRSIVDSGYWDVPCGADGNTCASPPPTIAPSARANAVPLRMPSLSIRVDRPGAYSVDIPGSAVIPNGILTEVSAVLANDTRDDVLIPDGIYLEVIGEDGKGIGNVYMHPWHRGTEEVRARLRFEVAGIDAPVTLELTDIVVR